MSGADLSNTDLRGADLDGTTLSEVDLSDADLEGASMGTNYRVITNEELEHQAKSLEGATMPDGTVFSDEFEPTLSFNPSDGWYRPAEAETPNYLPIYDLEGGQEGGQLLFTNPRQVFDPSNPSEAKEVPAPENAKEWVSWFQSHPNLDTSKPRTVSVGGASGMRIDVTVTSTPKNYPRDLCGEQACVPLYPTSAGVEGWKDRYVIVDVGGETVIIDAAAPTDKFDEFLPKAQKVLDTVEWKGG